MSDLSVADRASLLMARLTCRAPGLELGNGGVPNLTNSDIASALGMVDAELAALGQYLYMRDDGQRDRVHAFVREQAKAFARAYEWRIDSASVPRLERIADVALEEAMQSGECRRCAGRGSLMGDGAIITCPRCGGSGRAAMLDHDRAHLAKIPRSAWRRTWRDRYQVVLASIYRRVDAFSVELVRACR